MKVIFGLIFSLLFSPIFCLLDHLLWDYCQKGKISPKGNFLEIDEFEVDPFPFLKGHKIHFNLVRKKFFFY